MLTNNLKNIIQINNYWWKYMILIIVVSSSCSSPRIKKIDLVYAPYDATVMIPVDCHNFDYIFSESKKMVVISDQAELNGFQEELERLKKESSDVNVDVRIKCIIQFEKRVDTLCLGQSFGTILNGITMVDNPNLYKLITDKIYVK